MKTYLLKTLIIFTAFFSSCTPADKSSVEKTVKVWGNCEKCKARIETAAKINGVTSADWNIDSKLLKFKVDTAITSVNAVLKSVAKAGHDNDVYFADDYAYSKLPQTCQYERRTE
ncbi:MAG: mercury transporter [Bacteroidetes bacterium]|nr:mercury transporter [Bacteroidota bacterium]